MKRVFILSIAGCVSAALLSVGCQNKDDGHDHGRSTASVSSSATASATATPSSAAEAHASGDTVTAEVNTDNAVLAADKEAAKVTAARAEVVASKAPGDDDVKGVVEFSPEAHGVTVHYRITGLTPGKHGFHIHEKGDLSAPDFASAGGHFNPGGHKHGGPEGDARHGGDLGNITADDKGVAEGKVSAVGVTLDESKTGIIGRSIVVHEKADDLQTDPSGNSGGRIGAGVIKAASAGGGGGSGGAGGGKTGPQGEKDANNPAKQDKK